MEKKIINYPDNIETGSHYFFDYRKHEEHLISRLLEVGKKYHIKDIIPLDVKDISIARWVRLKCKYGCCKYGTNWCCPPESPDFSEMKEILNEYGRALLLHGTMINKHFYKNNNQKRRIQIKTWKATVVLERLLFLEGYYKAFSLVSDTCALCKECAYPDPCKFPKERRPTVASCSIDIFQTLKNIGKSYDIAQEVTEEYQSFSIILLG